MCSYNKRVRRRNRSRKASREKCCKSEVKCSLTCTLPLRTADRQGLLQMEILSHVANRQQRCKVVAVVDIKKEIPVNVG